jgi:signal peptidase II
MRHASLTRLLSIAALVAGIDQVVKAAVTSRLDLFNLTYIRNPGAAFGLLSGVNPSVTYPFFVGVTALAIAALGYLYMTTPPWRTWTRWGTACVLGGAVGNLIDRLRFREVIDFIDIYWGSYHWPAFNVADSAITIGVALIVLETLVRRERVAGG